MNGTARSCRGAAFAAIVIGLAACTHGGAERLAPHVLRIADAANPSSLNPLLAHDQETIGNDLLVTQTLVGLSAKNKLVPILVTRIPSVANGDISSDGTRIVYHLRHGVRFADGNELTSADVAFTFRSIRDPRNPVESEDAYRRVVALGTPDRYTIVIRLKKRWNAAAAELFAQADFAFGILPAHAFSSTDVTRAAWNDHPFGTGPFRVVDWERGNRIVLERNLFYTPRPKLDRLIFIVMPSTQAAFFALRAHDVDITQISPEQLRDAKGIPDAHVMITPVNGAYMLLLNVARPPTNDVRVRRAVAMAIDKREIVRGRGDALAPADSFLPPVFAWHDPAPATFASDARGAAAQLLAAVWQKRDGLWRKDGKPLVLSIVLQPELGTWMQVIEQEQLRALGIEAELKPYPSALFNAPNGPLRSGNFTLAANWWIGAADPEESVIFACSQRGPNGNNSTGYCNPRFDALFEDQAVTADARRRARDFTEMQRIVRHDVPAIPIAFPSYLDVVSNRVYGYARNMLIYPVGAERWDVR